MAFKIYTKTGDAGQTSLIGGTRIPKFDIRIEAYGTVDELNSNIGLIRDQDIDEHSKLILIEVQDRLFTIGSLLAADPEKNKMALPKISETDITLLEKEIDAMNEHLPEMKHFVLPGGHTTISFCHVARCVCRRAERCVLRLNDEYSVDELIYKYLNRLSDYLFVLSRKFTQELKATETPWIPRL
ncbi:MAG: cob(I)yrinic acid a,c-diamide adenosyltransferase [Bacteroidota bacterium]|jgi:cob(I)alamin adenosyltransferase